MKINNIVEVEIAGITFALCCERFWQSFFYSSPVSGQGVDAFLIFVNRRTLITDFQGARKQNIGFFLIIFLDIHYRFPVDPVAVTYHDQIIGINVSSIELD